MQNDHGPRVARALLPSTFERLPERLVGVGFRLWMRGLQTGDIEHWDAAWQVYEGTLGPRSARLAISELSSWVKAVRACARRNIALSPCNHQCFCRDECLAVSMVAACQHDVCPAFRSCAFALIESALIEDVMQQTESFSVVMRSLNQVLMPPDLKQLSPARIPTSIH